MMKYFILPFLFVLMSSMALAHEFHVGMCQVDYEEADSIMFCSIQLESGDFEHWLEDQNQKYNLNELAENQKNSPALKDFETFVLKNFMAKTNIGKVEFELFELEIEPDGRMFVYLVAYNVHPFSSVTWQFSLLMGHSMDQQNKLEFRYISPKSEQVYFLYFFENEHQKTIAIKL